MTLPQPPPNDSPKPIPMGGFGCSNNCAFITVPFGWKMSDDDWMPKKASLIYFDPVEEASQPFN